MPWTLYLKFFIVLLLGLLWLARCPHSTTGGGRSLADFFRDDRGGAIALDFVLTTIFYYPVIMCTIQFILILNAYQYVKYGAYYAARSAAVVIPEARENEGRNQLGPKKNEIVREAAAWAISPVSPTVEAVSVMPPTFQAYRSEYYAGIKAITAPILRRQALSPNAKYGFWEFKYGNAYAQTQVEIIKDQNQSDILPGDPVVVDVKYKFYLAWPLANVILRDWRSAFDYRLKGQNYCTLAAKCTMINEGWGDRPSHFPQTTRKKSDWWEIFGG